MHVKGVKMKFLISVDMEGVASMASSFGMKKDDKYFRERITREVNAVINGICKVYKKPKEIIVADSHNEGENILPEKLNSTANLIRGYPRNIYMMTGIDKSISMVFLIGYHAKTGTAEAVLDHTFSGQRIQRVEINGRDVGEFDLSAGLAGHYNVPVGFASGDDKFAEQVKKIAPWVKTPVTKYGLGRNAAKMIHPEKVDELLAKSAYEACRDIKKMKLLKFKNPVKATVDFSRTTMADVACMLPSVKRKGGRKIYFESNNFREFYDFFSAIVSLVHGVN